MEINSLRKLIIRQGLGAAVVGNWRNQQCVLRREVLDTQAVEKFCVFAKISKYRCPASICGSDSGRGRHSEETWGVFLVTSGPQRMLLA